MAWRTTLGQHGRCCHSGRGHIGPAPGKEEEVQEVGKEERKGNKRGAEIGQQDEPSSEPDNMPRLATRDEG